ncbi:KRFJ protein, partial [Neodrepanis coruscans]|nr:KRFJ protein [Neodrepanis coruscans]
MSPFQQCCLPGLLCPEPFAVTSNETLVLQYPDTLVDIVEPQQPPYRLIYPGPTLTTFPQQTIVGSSALLDLRSLLAARAAPPGCRGRWGVGGLCRAGGEPGPPH